MTRTHTDLILKYRCADYLESHFCEAGHWSDLEQLWLIEPFDEVEEHPEIAFLQVGRPGVDGIGFGYRAGLDGLWAYYPMSDEFEFKASTVRELVEGWLGGRISV